MIVDDDDELYWYYDISAWCHTKCLFCKEFSRKFEILEKDHLIICSDYINDMDDPCTNLEVGTNWFKVHNIINEWYTRKVKKSRWSKSIIKSKYVLVGAMPVSELIFLS